MWLGLLGNTEHRQDLVPNIRPKDSQATKHIAVQSPLAVLGCPGEQIGDAGDLGQPCRRGTDVGGCGGDIEQLHALTLARGSDITQQAGEDCSLGTKCVGPFGVAACGELVRGAAPLVDLGPHEVADLLLRQFPTRHLGGAEPYDGTCDRPARPALDNDGVGCLGVVDGAQHRTQRRGARRITFLAGSKQRCAE